ncbi:MAG: hydantoinase/oxoprolinase family protein [Alphaproteobacteria bacterium]|nr:hydantoinase/oxoprolinase family protein [Alphaproteobacteria bacterium]
MPALDATARPAGTSASIGIDVGGTFTDCVLIDETDGTVELTKVPTVRANPAQSVIDGIARLLERSRIPAHDVRRLGHGTTVATNTVIEESGARVGVLVTEGFRDVLALARVRFPRPTDINGALPRQLVSRRQVREVRERIGADGAVVVPVDTAQAVRAVGELIEECGITALAICFLHAYKNDAHERAVREAIEAAYPGLFVSSSAEVSPRPREYERSLTTVMNSYVGERMRRYLSAFRDEATARGIAAPPLVTRSNGGIMNVDTAGRFAVQTMLSGPAAGVVGALHFAQASGFERIIAWDMGGTSLDVSVIDGRLRHTDEARIGDFPLFIPTLDVMSIGAGGGSLGWVDPSGMLHVGPRSAGADPGPACYGKGGQEPTLTDAYVALGIIDPARFAAGELTLDREPALAALARLGARLGLSDLATAEAMIEVATAQIQTRFMPLIARYGIDPADYALFPYGGAGPMHCFLFARTAGIDRVVVPLFPGLLCAWGTIIADLRYEVPKSVDINLAELDEAAFNREIAALDAQALAWLLQQGVPTTAQHVMRLAHARYVGQSFELEVPLPGGRITPAEIRRSFVERYHARYGYSDPAGPIEIVSLISQGIGSTAKPSAMPRLRRPQAGARAGTRDVHIAGAWRTIPAIDREALEPGRVYQGPLVIDQSDTTSFVPEGFRVSIDAHRNIIGERMR